MLLWLNGEFGYVYVFFLRQYVGNCFSNVFRKQAGCFVRRKIGVAVQVRLRHVGKQRCHLDVVFSDFFKKTVCKAEKRSLGCPVSTAVRVCFFRRDRGEKEKLSAAALLHKWQNVGSKQHRCFDIGPDERGNCFVLQCFVQSVITNACVMDDDIGSNAVKFFF